MDSTFLRWWVWYTCIFVQIVVYHSILGTFPFCKLASHPTLPPMACEGLANMSFLCRPVHFIEFLSNIYSRLTHHLLEERKVDTHGFSVYIRTCHAIPWKNIVCKLTPHPYLHEGRGLVAQRNFTKFPCIGASRAFMRPLWKSFPKPEASQSP